MDSHIDRYMEDSSASSPVISGTRWFGPEHRPFVLRIEQPLTFDEMVAALYGVVELDDIVSDEDLCGSVAVTLLVEGLAALEARAAKLRRDEFSGAVESPEFLAICRQRVAALIGP
jgi:hypothetical protein